MHVSLGEKWERFVEAKSKAAKQIFASAAATMRKEYAAIFTQTPDSAILFQMLDGRDYAPLIGKLITAQPLTFTVDEEK
jgi:hypothetical protein